MTNQAESAAPLTAIRIWCDGLYLYAEIPGSPPYIHSESICEAGLWKMLNLLRKRVTEEPIASAKAAKLVTPRQPTRIEKVQATADQREKARDVLRKSGLLPGAR